jgi:PAS domain S-box-containing protein
MKTAEQLSETNRESLQLWLAVIVTLLLAAYYVAIHAIEPLNRFLQPYTSLPLARFLTDLLFLAALVALWLLYRRWQNALYRKIELERVIASIGPDVLLVVNPDRTIGMCNAGVHTMFGYDPDEVIGQTTEMLYFDRRLKGEKGEIFNALQKVGFHIGEAKGKRKDNTIFPLEIITGDIKGRPGAVVLIRDITRRKEVEQQLLEANQAKSETLEQLEGSYRKLQALEELRDDLTHMIVHDLKSPLASILGYLSLIQTADAEGDKEAVAGHVVEAERIGRKMQEMISSMLDVSRLESGKMPLKLEFCDLSEIAADALEVLTLDPEDCRVQIETAMGSAVVQCDPEIIRRVFVNLLSNALNFTPADNRIRVWFEQVEDGFIVHVRDKGPGIAPEYHQQIFTRFGQVDGGKCGTGLGLCFCKLAVEAHGGSISVDSKLDEGSTFSFHLPAVPPVTLASRPAVTESDNVNSGGPPAAEH